MLKELIAFFTGSLADEVTEIILFGFALVLIGGFVYAKQYTTAANFGGVWFGSFAMYIKGK